MKEHKTYKNKWFEFTPTWSGFAITYHVAGYFDPHPMLQIYFIWGKLFLYLPYKHYKMIKDELTIKEKRKEKLNKINGEKKIKPKLKKIYYDDCEPPRYGIYFHMNQIGICYGTKTKLYDLPWALDWIRTSALTKDGKWETETILSKLDNIGKCKDFWDKKKWGDILYYETHPYKYITKNNEEQNCLATIRVVEMEWRWKWFKWLRYTQLIKKSINIEFNDEVGERKGSWKGGCTGCSYEILPNETPFECLKRMEKERKFT